MKKTLISLLIVMLSILFLVSNGKLSADMIPSLDDPFSFFEEYDIAQIELGDQHSAILTKDGRVFTWGDNAFSQLGDGTSIERHTPTEITDNFSLNTGETINYISLGYVHSAALTSLGRVFMWGYNGDGELGNGTTNQENAPIDITSYFPLNEDETIESIVLGNYHSAALTSLGRVFMWGDNGNGQVGDGTTVNKLSPTDITNSFNLSEGEVIENISLGNLHSAARTSLGRVFTWGSNFYGTLGDNTTTDKTVPTDITSYFTLQPGETLTEIELGGVHSSALTSEHRVFMWGANIGGQLGDATFTQRNTPTNITSNFSLSAGETIIEIELGGGHSFAFTSFNRIFAYGNNNNGQLGDGTTENKNIPIDITNYVDLDTSETITDISLGGSHSFLLSSNGNMYLFGRNYYGQLGIDSTTDQSSPIKINSRFYPVSISQNPLFLNENITCFSLGASHTSVILNNKKVLIWGDNEYGQLGNGTTIDSTSPIDITSRFNLEDDEDISGIDLGGNYSLLVTSKGRVFTWGINAQGQLGDGTTTNSNIPIEITSHFNLESDEIITDIFAGANHSSAITSTGRIFMWGYNRYGQLGDGTVTQRNLPTDITSNFSLNTTETIEHMSLGGSHSSAITSEGRVFIWGYNGDGELGIGVTDMDAHSIPINITNRFTLNSGETLSTISLGAYHSSVLTSFGRIFIFGSNEQRQLADENNYGRNYPMDITTRFSLNEGETISTVALGFVHSSAVTSDGRIFMWGANWDGMLGDGTTTIKDVPTEITSNFSLGAGETIVESSLGYYHSSAITSDGRIFTWGRNIDGQLGNGTTTKSYTPISVNHGTGDMNNILFSYIEKEVNGMGQTITFSVFPEYDFKDKLLSISVNGTSYDDSSFTIHNGRIDVYVTNSWNVGDDVTLTLDSYTFSNNSTIIPIGDLSVSTTLVEDTTPPTFDNIPDQIIEAGVSDINWITVIENEADDSGGPLTKIEVEDNVDYDTPGTYTVTVKVVDESSNETSQTFTVEVVDTTPPTFDTIVDQTIEAGISDIDWTTVIENETDNSDGVLTKVEVEDNVDYNTPGTYKVTVKLLDESLNEAIHSFNVEVIDTTPPIFDNIPDQTIEAGVSDINWITVIENETDNSDGILTKVEVEDNVDYDTPGTYKVTVKLLDESLNETSKTFNVEVVDTTSPTFDNIPDQSIEAGVSDIDWTTLITNETDNSTGVLTKVEVEDTIDYTTPGAYTVTVKVTDESLNEAIHSFNVEVVDTTPPLASLNPTLTTIYVNDLFEDGGVAYTDLSEVTVTIDGMVDTSKVGTYTLLYTIEDASGNKAMLKRIVHVVDTNPTIEFKLDKVLTTISVGTDYIDGNCSVFVNGEIQLCSVLENNVNTTASGVYTITYSYSYNNIEYTYNRYVFVVDDSSNVSLYYDLPRKEGDWA